VDAVEPRLNDYHRLFAVRAHLHERAGDTATAAELFARAARSAPSTAERDHLLKRAAQARHHRADN
jgi:predicted RNA polymerase sigma factor